MTIELAKTLTDFKSLIDDWNARMVHTDEQLFTRLRGLNCRLSKELKKIKIIVIKVD